MVAAPLIVRIGGVADDPLTTAAAGAQEAAGRVPASLRLAVRLGESTPGPGGGRTAEFLSVLATVAAADLTTARVLEPHLDALAILSQAGMRPEPGAYGVFAAERPGLDPVRAGSGDHPVLAGTKPWCSLAGVLDRALITADQQGGRRLFDVDLRHPGATAVPGTWVSRGLAAVDSGDLLLDDVPARPVGGQGWYLRRQGFAWGGIGVAACWFGGAVAVARALTDAARRREPDQVGQAAIGEADRLLWAARCALSDAATRIDAGGAEGPGSALLAARVRGAVAEAAERVTTLVGHALGPAPLVFDEQHARRVADLTVYVRQHHAARDDAAAGRALLAGADGE